MFPVSFRWRGDGLIALFSLQVMVILDSLHAADHVLKEIEAYWNLTSPGQYLLVEDTHLDRLLTKDPAHPFLGPERALRLFWLGTEEWAREANRYFYVDRRREYMVLSQHKGGYLVRVG